MTQRLVLNVKDVAGFSPPGEDSWISKLLIDRQGVGSTQMVLNHFTVRAGGATGAGSHPEPYDEIYYVLRGKARLELGNPPEEYDIEPGVVAFIPAGTRHALHNPGSVDLELLTRMPREPVPGANPTYDQRLEAWGTSFKLMDGS